MKMTIPENFNIFFYDGKCIFCRKLAFILKKLNTDSQLIFLSYRDYTDEEFSKLYKGLTEELLEGEVQLIYNDKRYPGFFAVRKILPSLKYYKYLTPFLYLPLIPILGMIIMSYLKYKRSLSR